MPTWDGLLAERIGPRLNAAEGAQQELLRLQSLLARVTASLRPSDLDVIAELAPEIPNIAPMPLPQEGCTELEDELASRRVPAARELVRQLAREGRAVWLLALIDTRDLSAEAIEWLALSALIEATGKRVTELLTTIARLRGVHRGTGPLVEPRPDVNVVARLREALDLFRLELETVRLEVNLRPTPGLVGFPDELTDSFALLIELCLRAGADELAIESQTTASGDVSVGVAGYGSEPLESAPQYDTRKFALAKRLIGLCHDGRLELLDTPGLSFWAWLPSRPALHPAA